MNRRRRLRWIGIVLLIGILLAACGGDDDNGDGDTAPADLTVASVAVDPARPTAGQPFTIRVTVKNQGEAESGSFSITVGLRDVARDERFTVGSFTGGPIGGGAESVVYEGEYHGLDNAGSYQVQVQIGYNADSNTENNQQNKAFTVIE
jgi:subtilase family serine protease